MMFKKSYEVINILIAAGFWLVTIPFQSDGMIRLNSLELQGTPIRQKLIEPENKPTTKPKINLVTEPTTSFESDEDFASKAEQYLEMLLEKSEHERKFNFKNPIETGVDLADALYMIQDLEYPLSRDVRFRAKKMVAAFLSEKKYSLTDRLNQLMQDSERPYVKQWMKWVKYLKKFGAKLFNVKDTEVKYDLDPRTDQNLNQHLLAIVTLEKEIALQAYTKGGGFCTLSEYPDTIQDLSSDQEKISKILYLLKQSFQMNLQRGEIHHQNPLKLHRYIFYLCENMRDEPLPDEANRILEIKQYKQNLTNIIDDFDKLKDVCSANVHIEIDKWEQFVTSTILNTKIDYPVSWTQTLNETLNEIKTIAVLSCLGVLHKELKAGLAQIDKRAKGAAQSLEVTEWMEIIKKHCATLGTEFWRYYRKEKKLDAKVADVSNLDEAAANFEPSEHALESQSEDILNPRRDHHLNVALARSIKKSDSKKLAYENGSGLCSIRNAHLDYVSKTLEKFLDNFELQEYASNIDPQLLGYYNFVLVCDKLAKTKVTAETDARRINYKLKSAFKRNKSN